MLTHYYEPNEEIVIGFFSVDLEHKKAIKKISKLMGYDFTVLETDKYSDVGDFNHDTLVLNSKYFCEDLLEILDYGISLHIIDY